MSDFRIKVTTETLVSVSQDVIQKVNKVQKAFDEIDSIVRGTASYWDGDGHAECNKYFEVRKDDYDRILRELKTHVENLQLIAGGYKEVEEKTTSYSGMLPEDIIV